MLNFQDPPAAEMYNIMTKALIIVAVLVTLTEGCPPAQPPWGNGGRYPGGNFRLIVICHCRFLFSNTNPKNFYNLNNQ